jgi:hypothetical protein
MRRIIPTFALLVGGLLWCPVMGAERPWPAAERPVHIDEAGVLRWSDAQDEVALSEAVRDARQSLHGVGVQG